jgi:hypothetical protein
MSKLRDCIAKIKSNREDFNNDVEVLLGDEQSLLDSGMDEISAAREVLKKYHKSLFEEMNELKSEVGLQTSQYTEPAVSGDVELLKSKYDGLIAETRAKREELQAKIEEAKSQPATATNSSNMQQDESPVQETAPVQEPQEEEINEQPVEEEEFELAEEDIVNQIASDYANAITGDVRDGVIMLGKALRNAWSSLVPNLKVVTDNYRTNLQELADQGLIEPDMVNVYMTYPGMYFNNTVFLNPDKVGLDTPIHEFGHVWYQVAKQVRPEVVERGRSLIRGTQYLSDVQNTPEYAGLTPEQMEEEALITAIGDRGAKFVEQSILTQFKDWLKELFDTIGMLVKSHTGKPLDVSSLSLDEYLDVAAQDILSGGKVLLNEVSAEAVSSFAYEGVNEGVNEGVKINLSIASSKRIESVLPSFKNKVAQAEKMLAEGKSAEQIYKATNLSKGIEGDWQYDMDYNVVLKPSVNLTSFRKRLEEAKPGSGLNLKLQDVISYPMLFQMYPELREVGVVFLIDQDDYIGGVNREVKKILINLDKRQFYEVEDMAAQYGVTGEGAVDKGYLATILHEVQHMIQIADNMPLGTSPELSFKHAAEKVASIYRKEAEITGEEEWVLAAEEVANLDYESEGAAADFVRSAADLRYRISTGEVQARNVEKRFFEEDARYLPIENTEDVPRNKQIVDRDKAPALSVGTKNKIANPVKAVRDVMESNPYKKFMTEDGDNYYFFHWSDDERKVIDPAKFGANNFTSREERIARPSAAFFYTRPDFAERGVGDYGHVVKVPKHKVYPATADPLKFYNKAKEMFEKAHPGMAFGANQQIGWVTKVANANGFDMTVAKWGGQLRAETTEKVKVEVYRQPQGWGVKYNPKYEKLKRGANPKLSIKSASELSSLSVDEYKKIKEKTRRLSDAGKDVEQAFFSKFWPSILKKVGFTQNANPKNFASALSKSMPDLIEWLKSNPQYVDYYHKDWDTTRAILNSAFNGGITDDEFVGFRLMTGLTSPSTKLYDNLVDAVMVFDLFKTNGSFNGLRVIENPRTGNLMADRSNLFTLRSTTGSLKIRTLLIIESMYNRIGSWQGVLDELYTQVDSKALNDFNKEAGYKGSVGEIGAIRNIVKEATGQDELIPKMFIFGKKVGAYTLNVTGKGEYTTTDIWESRFIRSHFPSMFKVGTGLPTNIDESIIFQSFASHFNEELNKTLGTNLDPSAMQAIRWFYMIEHSKKAGYEYANTNETISGYTEKAIREVSSRLNNAGGGLSNEADNRRVPSSQPTARLSVRSGYPLDSNFGVKEVEAVAKMIREKYFFIIESSFNDYVLFVSGQEHSRYTTAAEARESMINIIVKDAIMANNPGLSESIARNIANNGIFKALRKGQKRDSIMSLDPNNPMVSIPYSEIPVTSKRKKAIQKAKSNLANFFSVGGALPSETVAEREAMRGRENVDISVAERYASKIKDKIKELIKRKELGSLDEKDTFDITAKKVMLYLTEFPPYIPGAASYRQQELDDMMNRLGYIHPELLQIVQEMRTLIDKNTVQLIEEGLVSPVAAENMMSNLGKYVTRSYSRYVAAEKWQKWINSGSQDAIDARAKMHLGLGNLYYNKIKKENPSIDDNEALKLAGVAAAQEIHDMVELSIAQSSFFPGSYSEATPSRDTSILKKKEDLPDWYREFLGEYRDPSIVFLRTMSAQTSLLNTSRYYKAVRDMGLKMGFLFEEGERPEWANYKIEGDRVGLLSGLYTSKEIYDELFSGGVNNTNEILNYFIKLANANKYNKTILSPGTQTKNFVSNIIIATMNGHVNPVYLGLAWDYFKNRVVNNQSEELLKELEPLMARGVMGQNFTVRELQSLFKEDNLDSYILSKMKESASAWETVVDRSKDMMIRVKFLERAYGAADDFWKISAFFQERNTQSKILFGKRYEDLNKFEKSKVDDEAAEIIKNTYPTYDRVLKAFKVLSKTGLFGTFISFQAEILRTSYNGAKIASKYIKRGIAEGNSELLFAGLRRLAGAASTVALTEALNLAAAKASGVALKGLGGLLGTFLSSLSPDEDDEEKNEKDTATKRAYDLVVPDWAKVGDKWVVPDAKFKENGVMQFYMTGSLNPYDIWYRASNAFFDGNSYAPGLSKGNIASASEAVFTEVFQDFWEPEMTARIFVESFFVGVDSYGNRLYPQTGKYKDEQFLIGVKNFAQQTLVPAGFWQAYRFAYTKDGEGNIKRQFSESELLGLIGARPYKVESYKSFDNYISKEAETINRYVTQDFKRAKKSEGGLYGDIRNLVGLKRSDRVEDANEEVNSAVARINEFYTSMKIIGLDEGKINEILMKSSLPVAVKNAAMTGQKVTLYNEEGKIKSSSSSSSRPNTRASSRPSTRR